MASTIRQFDKSTSSESSNSNARQTLSTNSVILERGIKHTNARNNLFKNLSIQQLRAKILYSRCRACNKLGRSDTDHNADASTIYGPRQRTDRLKKQSLQMSLKT